MKPKITTWQQALKFFFIDRFPRFLLVVVFIMLLHGLSKSNCTEVWLWLKSINLSIIALGCVWLMDRWLYHET